MTIDISNIKYYIGDDVENAILISDQNSIVTVNANGQELSFTIEELAQEKTIHLLIPTTVPSSSTNITFQNTAYITSANSVAINEQSNTTYHKMSIISIVIPTIGVDLGLIAPVAVLGLFSLTVLAIKGRRKKYYKSKNRFTDYGKTKNRFAI